MRNDEIASSNILKPVSFYCLNQTHLCKLYLIVGHSNDGQYGFIRQCRSGILKGRINKLKIANLEVVMVVADYANDQVTVSTIEE